MVEGLCREVFAIPHGKDFIVYAPLQGAVLACNESMVALLDAARDSENLDKIADTYPEAVTALRRAGLIVQKEELDQEDRLLSVLSSPPSFTPTEATFLVTTNCNLRCLYCYASAGERHVTIPLETCHAAIEFIVRNAVELGTFRCHIAFHGAGEPTTAFGLIRRCVEYAHRHSTERGVTCTYSLVTNGILSASQIDWLIGHVQNVSISLDGPPDIQNAQRPMRNGEGSFDRVFKSIRALETGGLQPFVRATITNTSVGRMREISHFFAENLKSDIFQLEPVAVCGRCATTGYREPTVQDFVTGVEEAMAEAITFGKRAVCSAALEMFPNVTEEYCGVTGPNFAVTPEGNVTACYEVSAPMDPRGSIFYYGHFDSAQNQFVFNEPIIHRLRSRVVQNIERCKNCFCRWQCAGDCPVRSVWQFPEQESESSTSFRCQMTRELVKRRLAKLVETTNACTG